MAYRAFRCSHLIDDSNIKKSNRQLAPASINFGRGERIRTSDLSVPNRAHYQAVLRPVSFLIANGRAILASASAKGQGTKEFRAVLKCLRTVTYSIFYFGRQFGERQIEALRNKDGVITKAIRSARPLNDGAVTDTAGNIQDLSGRITNRPP